MISSNFSSSLIPREGANIIRLSPRFTIEETWSYHQAEALRKSMEVEPLSEIMTFGDYVLMSTIEEDPSQYFHS